MKLELDGLTVVIERAMQDALENATIAFDKNAGIVVTRQPL